MSTISKYKAFLAYTLPVVFYGIFIAAARSETSVRSFSLNYLLLLRPYTQEIKNTKNGGLSGKLSYKFIFDILNSNPYSTNNEVNFTLSRRPNYPKTDFTNRKKNLINYI